MCNVTVTDEWRLFFNSIGKWQHKIFRKTAAGINQDVVVMRREQFEELVNRAGMKVTVSRDKCLNKGRDLEARK